MALIGCGGDSNLAKDVGMNDKESTILVFGENISLLGKCQLHTRQSILGNNIRITCESVKDDEEQGILEIKIGAASECLFDNLFPKDVIEEVVEINNFEKYGRKHLEAKYRFKDSRFIFYKRAINDKEICFEASAVKRAKFALESSTMLIWD
tara:strand:+ start:2900 stop:3355 length:456 start_codon:yes stop_codon:yes gene_type:complete